MTANVRQQVSEAYAALAFAGQTDMVWGHVSLRDPDGRGLWIKAAGWGFEEVTDERVHLVSPRGEVLEGEGRPHLEYPIHSCIMAARSDVNAVVHGHAASTAVFGSLDVPLRALSHDAVPFAKPDIPRYTHTGNLVRDEETGRRLAEALGEGAGVLMPAHGFAVVGESLAVAVMRAVLLERACRNQLQALAAGGPVRWSDDEEIAAKDALVWASSQYAAGYDYLVRRATAARTERTT